MDLKEFKIGDRVSYDAVMLTDVLREDGGHRTIQFRRTGIITKINCSSAYVQSDNPDRYATAVSFGSLTHARKIRPRIS